MDRDEDVRYLGRRLEPATRSRLLEDARQRRQG